MEKMFWSTFKAKGRGRNLLFKVPSFTSEERADMQNPAPFTKYVCIAIWLVA